MTKPLFTLDNVSVDYGKRQALQKISGAFQQGSLTAIAGPNGSGKSTLLKVIAGMLSPSRGRILFSGGKRPPLAYLSQASAMQRDFPISVLDVVLTGLYPASGEYGRFGKAQHDIALKALESVGLERFAPRQISELSGGEFQRMLFARVMVQDAPLILLDEPFSAVDADTTRRLMQILLEWHGQGRTIICVLHDLLLIKKYFPESLVLHGKCLGSGHTHTLFEQKLLSFDLDMAEIHTKDECAKLHGDDDHHRHHHEH